MSVSGRVNYEFEGRYAWPAALEERENIHPGGAVYALLAAQPFPRLVGMTRILYIGQTTHLGGNGNNVRLRDYRFHPINLPSGRIRTRIEVLIREQGWQVYLRWHAIGDRQERQNFEAELLRQHSQEHLELPPFNGQGGV
ncbi:MAG: hypothetical protein ACRER0_04615 [Gammaproteobacteria bacterium]